MAFGEKWKNPVHSVARYRRNLLHNLQHARSSACRRDLGLVGAWCGRRRREHQKHVSQTYCPDRESEGERNIKIKIKTAEIETERNRSPRKKAKMATNLSTLPKTAQKRARKCAPRPKSPPELARPFFPDSNKSPSSPINNYFRTN